MQQNILRDSNITKIYLMYVNTAGSRKREAVTLRYMDNKECFFTTSNSLNFVKPKRKTPAEIRVYTADGVYKTKITINDTNTSINEILYEVSLPSTWDFIQLRSSTRKRTELPISIKFNDGFEINASTYDLAICGISFFSKKRISSIYEKISGILTLELPPNTIINFPNGKLTVETKFVRKKEEVEGYYDEVLYIFKFINMNLDDELILKNYLIKLD